MLKIYETSRLTKAETWAISIREKYSRTVEAIIDVGRDLIAAKADLPHGEFEHMVRRRLPFGERQAQRYMAVAACPRVCSPEIRPLLPGALSILYDIVRIDDAVWEVLLSNRAIKPGLTQIELASLVDAHTVLLRPERVTPSTPPPQLATVVHIPSPPKLEAVETLATDDRSQTKDSHGEAISGEFTPQHHKPEVFIAPAPGFQPEAEEPEQEALSGEFIPADPKPAPAEHKRPGITFEAASETASSRLKTEGELLREARTLLNRFAERRSVSFPDAVQATAWVAMYECLKIRRQSSL